MSDWAGIKFPKVKQVSAKEFREGQKKAKKQRGNKYGAIRTADGFPSKLEAAVYQMLLLRQKAGEIRDVKRQPSVKLTPSITWKVDFSFTHVFSGLTAYCEAKGKWTEAAGLKLRLWRDGFGPGPLEIWQGNYRRPILVEVVTPKALSTALNTVPFDLNAKHAALPVPEPAIDPRGD